MYILGYKYEVHQIKTFLDSSWINYSYIVVDKGTGAALIIDPAWELDKVLCKLKDLDAQLKAIVLTHSHFDHTNLVVPLCERFNTVVYMSQAEIDSYGFRCKNLYSVNDSDIIRTGETEMTCLLTPGHTAGGMCYLLPDSLFTGDTVFIEGCGICSYSGGSPVEMFESIQRLKSIIHKDVSIYPGHSFVKSPGYSLEYLMSGNIYFQFDKLESFINFRIRSDQIYLNSLKDSNNS